MEREYVIYAAYLLFFIILMGLVLAAPLLSFGGDAQWLYDAFGPTCHQKISRSLCVFTEGKGYWFGDCTPQKGEFINNAADRETFRVENDGVVGYKMPICARDVGIYGAMLLGGIVYPLVRNLREKRLYPAIFLILALVPLGIDGGVQFLSDARLVPFAYESTNTLRLVTGGIAGIAAAFYTIPLLINLFGKEKGQVPADKQH